MWVPLQRMVETLKELQESIVQEVQDERQDPEGLPLVEGHKSCSVGQVRQSFEFPAEQVTQLLSHSKKYLVKIRLIYILIYIYHSKYHLKCSDSCCENLFGNQRSKMKYIFLYEVCGLFRKTHIVICM